MEQSFHSGQTHPFSRNTNSALNTLRINYGIMLISMPDFASNSTEKTIYSKDGLLDLLKNKTNSDAIRYPIIHLIGDDIEMALTHGNQYGEEYYSFVNGQYTTQGGTHLAAFREAIVKTIRDHFGKNYDARDIQTSIIGAISVRVEEPVFESQTKTKLGSQNVAPEGATIEVICTRLCQERVGQFSSPKSRVRQSDSEENSTVGKREEGNCWR